MRAMLQKFAPHLAWAGAVSWAIYAGLSLAAAQPADKYGLNRAEVIGLDLTILLPVLVIWWIAMGGVGQLQTYAAMIRDSVDGRAIGLVADGVLWIVLSFILSTLLSSVLPYLVNSTWLYPGVFVKNHLPMVLNLVGFVLVLVGARRLAHSSGHRLSREYLLIILLPYFILGMWFGSYSFLHLEHTVTAGVPNISLPGNLTFFTLGLPSILTILIGVVAIAYLLDYREHVKGVIYRLALKDLVLGLGLILSFAAVLQVLLLAGSLIGSLNLAPLLLLIYVILAWYSVGFIYIRRGSRRLAKLEAGP